MPDSKDVGPIEIERDEPPSRTPWEARIAALWSALNVPQMKGYFVQPPETPSSPAAPQDPPLDYFQQRYERIVDMLVATRLITHAELESGRAADGSRMPAPLLTAEFVASWFTNDDNPWKCEAGVRPRFEVGQLVYARNLDPDFPRRCSAYARDKFGVIERDHGVFAMPHRTDQRLDDESQHLYSVRFSASQLWGHAHPKDVVFVNMWGDELQAI